MNALQCVLRRATVAPESCHRVLGRTASTTERCYATASRTANQFTFSTRYPRQQKPKSRSSKHGSQKSRKIPGIVLPARLKLARVSKSVDHQQSTQPDARPRMRVGSGHGAKVIQSASRVGPRRLTSRGNKDGRTGGYQISDEDLAKRKAHAEKFALSTTSFANARPESIAIMEQKIRQSKFANMGLREDLVRAMEEMGFTKPTEVQALCIPEAVARTNEALLCAAETGSGKTLAYLLPIIHHLKQEEAKALATVDATKHSIIEAVTSSGDAVSSTSGLASVRKLRRPRAVIIVPSRELVNQVTKTAKQVCHTAKLHVEGVHHSTSPKRLALAVQSPIDIMITTPGTLKNLMEFNNFSLSQTKHVVVDEADTMFQDAEFSADLEGILLPARELATKLSHPLQLLFVSATLPKTVMRSLQQHFPNIHTITTPHLHRTLPRLKQNFIRIDSGTTKEAVLLEVLKRAVLTDEKIVVFCNTRKHCAAVGEFLRSKSYDAIDISSNTDVKVRAAALARFTTSTGSTSEKPCVLIATDLASRGLDMRVGHVILYDFPQTAIDYLHRVGRTARAGGKGRATSIVAKKDRELATMIENSIKRKMVLT
ncbi:hypothetical protein HDU85_002248 [Gaertneriomyces sp. JEL0708]|nr:hypothetical protein HDU85_002248 [Gaertneriomyces sp. JEL0708]